MDEKASRSSVADAVPAKMIAQPRQRVPALVIAIECIKKELTALGDKDMFAGEDNALIGIRKGGDVELISGFMELVIFVTLCEIRASVDVDAFACALLQRAATKVDELTAVSRRTIRPTGVMAAQDLKLVDSNLRQMSDKLDEHAVQLRTAVVVHIYAVAARLLGVL